MRVLDLFCCQGGASEGYRRAGFEPHGVDVDPQPRYPFSFYQGDAIALLEHLIVGGRVPFVGKGGRWQQLALTDFAFIHASPPCQAYTLAQRIQGREHPDLVAPTRDLLEETGLPYAIENVEGAPLLNPTLLCGSMFPGLRVYRHRLFETNFPVIAPEHPAHVAPLRKMGRPPQGDDFMHVVGNFSGVNAAKVAMGIDWMNRDGLRESIPPAMTELVGRQLRTHLEQRLAA